MSPLAYILALPVRAYRLTFKSWVGHNCRFEPTCSCYTLQALEKHGAIKGGALAAWRILRCNPWGGMGFDPVPGCETYGDDCRCGHAPSGDKQG